MYVCIQVIYYEQTVKTYTLLPLTLALLAPKLFLLPLFCQLQLLVMDFIVLVPM